MLMKHKIMPIETAELIAMRFNNLWNIIAIDIDQSKWGPVEADEFIEDKGVNCKDSDKCMVRGCL